MKTHEILSSPDWHRVTRRSTGIPFNEGCYVIIGKRGPLYAGTSRQLWSRVFSHFPRFQGRGPIRALVIKMRGKRRTRFERKLILALRPPFNKKELKPKPAPRSHFTLRADLFIKLKFSAIHQRKLTHNLIDEIVESALVTRKAAQQIVR